jgi:predicted nuclease with TOPRIM domain
VRLGNRRNQPTPFTARGVQEAVTVLAAEREAHEEDKQRLSDMDRIQKEIENRMVQLQEMTDELVKENEQLKVEKNLLEEEARYAQKENQELRNEASLLRLRNTELETKVRTLSIRVSAGLLCGVHIVRCAEAFVWRVPCMR